MSARHTPGPWLKPVVNDRGDALLVSGPVKIWQHEGAAPEFTTVARVPFGEEDNYILGDKVARANAALIAAAPELARVGRRLYLAVQALSARSLMDANANARKMREAADAVSEWREIAEKAGIE